MCGSLKINFTTFIFYVIAVVCNFKSTSNTLYTEKCSHSTPNRFGIQWTYVEYIALNKLGNCRQNPSQIQLLMSSHIQVTAYTRCLH